MKKIVLFFALCCQAFAQQSYHIIRVIPSGSTVGEVDLQGNSSHATSFVILRPDSTGTSLSVIGTHSGNIGPLKVIDTSNAQGCLDFYISVSTVGDTQENSICAGSNFPFVLRGNTTSPLVTIDHAGNTVFARSDDAYLTVDASGNARLGFTKKSGAIPRLTYGSGINFEIGQSSTTGIDASSTFTTHIALDASTGAPNFTFNSPTTGAIFTQSGAGSAITINISNASHSIDVANTGSGDAIYSSANSGNGVHGISASGNGLQGESNSGIGVLGTGLAPIGSAIGVKGIGGGAAGTGVYATAAGSGGFGGVGLFAEATGSGGVAGHFASGVVQIDNSLTVSGSSGASTAINATGLSNFTFAGNGTALQVSNTGGHTALNVLSGDTFIQGAATLSGGTTISNTFTISGTSTLSGTMAVSGALGGLHAQLLGHGDAPIFDSLLLNGSSPPGGIGLLVTKDVEIDGGLTTEGQVTLARYAASNQLNLRRANGSLGSETAILNTNLIGAVAITGFDGSAYSGPAARVSTNATQNWSSTAHGTSMTLSVTPNNTTTLTAAIVIDNAGGVSIAGLSGAGNLPACLDAGGKVFAGSNTAGVLTCP